MIKKDTRVVIPVDDLPIVNRILDAERRKFNPQAPWKNKRALEKEDAVELSTPEKFYEEVMEIDDIRTRCLIVLLYVCAARIGEVVRKKMWKYGKKEVYLINRTKRGRGRVTDYSKSNFIKQLPSIRKRDISIQPNIKGKVMIIRIRNEKNRDLKRQYKRLPLPLNSEMNIKFAEVISQYISTIYDDDELFFFEQRRAQQILNEEGINPHFLRELRLTHLAKFNGLTDQQLVFFAGWTDSRPSKNYIKMRPEDLINIL